MTIKCLLSVMKYGILAVSQVLEQSFLY